MGGRGDRARGAISAISGALLATARRPVASPTAPGGSAIRHVCQSKDRRRASGPARGRRIAASMSRRWRGRSFSVPSRVAGAPLTSASPPSSRRLPASSRLCGVELPRPLSAVPIDDDRCGVRTNFDLGRAGGGARDGSDVVREDVRSAGRGQSCAPPGDQGARSAGARVPRQRDARKPLGRARTLRGHVKAACSARATATCTRASIASVRPACRLRASLPVSPSHEGREGAPTRTAAAAPERRRTRGDGRHGGVAPRP